MGAPLFELSQCQTCLPHGPGRHRHLGSICVCHGLSEHEGAQNPIVFHGLSSFPSIIHKQHILGVPTIFGQRQGNTAFTAEEGRLDREEGRSDRSNTTSHRICHQDRTWAESWNMLGNLCQPAVGHECHDMS